MIATFGKGGFIGSYLPTEFVGVDVDVRTEPTTWPRDRKFDAALNLACVQPARGIFSEEDYEQVNVYGFLRIAAWALHFAKQKVVTMASQKTSTEGELGKLVAADARVIDVVGLFPGLTVLRLPPVIGPGPYIAKSGLGQMIEGAKQGRIEVWGNPSNSRAVISVHDVVSAIQYLVKSDLQGVFSIGIPLSLESEVKAVQEVFGGELVYRPEIDNGIRQDIEVSGIPGWGPRWTFREMVMELKGSLPADGGLMRREG
jgi:nucleoside-diphosphate-sugar epimerase